MISDKSEINKIGINPADWTPRTVQKSNVTQPLKSPPIGSDISLQPSALCVQPSAISLQFHTSNIIHHTIQPSSFCPQPLPKHSSLITK